MKKLLLFVLLIIGISTVNAQDAVYSQYWANPVYLNPAFTGTNGTRLTLNHRNQWPTFAGSYNTSSLAFDFKPCNFNNTGVGIMAVQNVEGAGFLTTTTAAFNYAYIIEQRGKFQFSMGLQPSLVHKRIDMSKFVFGDQIDPVMGAIYDTEVNIGENPQRTFFDMGAGAVLRFFTPMRMTEDLYSNIGFSVNHILRPNQAFIGSESRLPLRVSVHGGTMVAVSGIKSKAPVYLVPSMRAEWQQTLDNGNNLSQFDAGLYIMRNPVIAGANLRTNLNSERYNGKTLGLMFGFKGVFENRFNYLLTYNYDVNFAGMNRSNIGAHELALNITFEDVCLGKRKGRIRSRSKCFDFDKQGIIPIF